MGKALERLLKAVDMTAQRKCIELPDGSEFEFYVTPLTAAEREQAMKTAGDNAQRFGLELIIRKCRDENGTPLFAPGELAQLRRDLPSEVIDALTLQILGKDKGEAEDEEEGPVVDEVKSSRAGTKA